MKLQFFLLIQVAAVRTSAIGVHSVMVKTLLEDDQSSGLVRVLLADLIQELVKSDSWIHRQTYASLALTLFLESSLDQTQFAQDVLPNLMDLSEDKVPNVRLAVARALKQLRTASKYLLLFFERNIFVGKNCAQKNCEIELEKLKLLI